MDQVRFYGGDAVPLEMHKVRIVQKLTLLPVEERCNKINEAGNNSFLLQNKDVYLDMLTDSGVNAMSDNQLAAMMQADDSYAGSETFARLSSKLNDIFGKRYFLPAHQGRACEHLLARALVRPGSVALMNYHFTTTKAHIGLAGGTVDEILCDAGLAVNSDNPFKGDIDLEKLEDRIKKYGRDNIAFVRIEAGTNLIGGQPVSLQNFKDVYKITQAHGLVMVVDASLLADNLYFIKTREAACKDMSIREIARAIADNCDILYFSARKLGCARGGGLVINDEALTAKLKELVPLFEGFLTYGGMSVREMEAITVGLEETMDLNMVSQGPLFIAYMADELVKRGVPVVTPAGGLGVHLNAMDFVPHIPQTQYPAGALSAAMYIASGARGMERGTLSEERKPNGEETLSNMELLRLALPRRVFTLSQIKYAVDRIAWLYENRDLIEGLVFSEEPKVLRFFLGRLKPVTDWQARLTVQFKKDFGDSL